MTSAAQRPSCPRNRLHVNASRPHRRSQPPHRHHERRPGEPEARETGGRRGRGKRNTDTEDPPSANRDRTGTATTPRPLHRSSPRGTSGPLRTPGTTAHERPDSDGNTDRHGGENGPVQAQGSETQDRGKQPTETARQVSYIPGARSQEPGACPRNVPHCASGEGELRPPSNPLPCLAPGRRSRKCIGSSPTTAVAPSWSCPCAV